MSPQCNNSSNENGTSNERIERDEAATAEFVRALFRTTGRITTGSSASRWEIKKTHYYHIFYTPDVNPECTCIVLRSGIIRKEAGQPTWRQSVGGVVNPTLGSNYGPTCASFSNSGLLGACKKRRMPSVIMLAKAGHDY